MFVLRLNASNSSFAMRESRLVCFEGEGTDRGHRLGEVEANRVSEKTKRDLEGVRRGIQRQDRAPANSESLVEDNRVVETFIKIVDSYIAQLQLLRYDPLSQTGHQAAAPIMEQLRKEAVPHFGQSSRRAQEMMLDASPFHLTLWGQGEMVVTVGRSDSNPDECEIQLGDTLRSLDSFRIGYLRGVQGYLSEALTSANADIHNEQVIRAASYVADTLTFAFRHTRGELHRQIASQFPIRIHVGQLTCVFFAEVPPQRTVRISFRWEDMP